MDEQSKILIIEDDPDIIESTKIILESRKYQVISAETPEEGFQKAKKEKPDLIILDVMFGSTGESLGFDYAVKMKQEKELAPIPILMITSVNVQNPGFGFSDETDGEYLPVDDFIDKPAQPEDLIQKVEKLLKIKISKWKNWPEKN